MLRHNHPFLSDVIRAVPDVMPPFTRCYVTAIRCYAADNGFNNLIVSKLWFTIKSYND